MAYFRKFSHSTVFYCIDLTPRYHGCISPTIPLHQALTQNISAVLANLPREPGQEKSPVRVGFITYAQQIHYYNLNPNLAQPGMLVSHIRPDSSLTNPQW